MTNWQAGDIALCIDGSDRGFYRKHLPISGKYYTVGNVEISLFMSLDFNDDIELLTLWLLDGPDNVNGLNENTGPCWPANRFIKIDRLLNENEINKEKELDLV